MRPFFSGDKHEETEFEKLTQAIKELTMSTVALTAAITQLNTDVATLVSLSENSVPQAQVDAATASVTALDATVVAAIAAINPPATAAAPAAPATPTTTTSA